MKRISLVWVILSALIGISASAYASIQTYLPIVDRQATLTPTPKPPTPTQTSTPTATPIPYGIIYLPNTYSYESGNMMHVVGELLNNTSDPLYSIEVPVNFYNSGDYPVGSGSTFMTPLNLLAWQKGCFNIIMDIPPDWSYYQFDPPNYDPGAPSPDLTIMGESGGYIASTGDYIISGEVANGGSQYSYNVSVGATLYNNANVPVGCGYNYVDTYDIAPYQTSSFTIELLGTDRDYGDVASYRLRVAGDQP